MEYESSLFVLLFVSITLKIHVCPWKALLKWFLAEIPRCYVKYQRSVFSWHTFPRFLERNVPFLVGVVGNACVTWFEFLKWNVLFMILWYFHASFSHVYRISLNRRTSLICQFTCCYFLLQFVIPCNVYVCHSVVFLNLNVTRYGITRKTFDETTMKTL